MTDINDEVITREMLKKLIVVMQNHKVLSLRVNEYKDSVDKLLETEFFKRNEFDEFKYKASDEFKFNFITELLTKRYREEFKIILDMAEELRYLEKITKSYLNEATEMGIVSTHDYAALLRDADFVQKPDVTESWIM